MRCAGVDRIFERDDVAAGFLNEAGEAHLLLTQSLHQDGNLGAHLFQREVDALAGTKQRMTLAGEFLEQGANAMFVLIVRALEVCNLTLHQ